VTGWLLDTNILSELRRPKPEHKVLAFVAAQPLDLLYVSSATIAEIRFGIELVNDANRRAELNDWLAHKVRPMFEQRILAITEDIMFKWRLLVEDGRKGSHTFSQPDLIIGATALHHGLTVVCERLSAAEHSCNSPAPLSPHRPQRAVQYQGDAGNDRTFYGAR
jgi:predicted nucleic acid-binding protein